MLSIFICEDNQSQRERMEAIVRNYILIENYSMELTLSVGSPSELLDYLEVHPAKNALYFLDVDLQHEMNGILLAFELRKLDAFGKIVFITVHAELSYLTFKYRVEALDYIIKSSKNDIANRRKDRTGISARGIMLLLSWQ